MPTDLEYKLQLLNKTQSLGLHTQTHLLSLMNHMGYPINNYGVCHGFALMAIQAFQAGDIETFNERKRYIITERNEIYKAVTSLKIKLESNIPFKKLALTPHEKKVLEMKSFFDGIDLYQRPYLRDEIFAEEVNQQEVEKVIPIISSKAIEKQGGLVKHDAWMGIYKKDDLQRYMNSLDKIATSSNTSLTFYLDCTDHAISLIYNSADQSWIINDANNPSITIVSKDLLAEKIMQMFFAENVDTDAVTFRTTPYSLNNDNNFQQVMTQLKQDPDFVDIHQINAYHASLVTHRKETLALLAISKSKDDIYKEIAAIGGNIDQDDLKGFSAKNYFMDRNRSAQTDKDEIAKHYIKLCLIDTTPEIREEISSSSEKLSVIYNFLSENKKIDFLTLLAEGWFDLRIVDSQDLELFSLFSEAQQKHFIDRASNEFLAGLIKKPNDLLIILKILPENKQNSLLEHIGQIRLLELLPTTFVLRGFSLLLTENRKKEFFESLSNQQLMNYITRPHDLIIILKLLTHERQNDFLQHLAKNNLLLNQATILQLEENNHQRIESFAELNKILGTKTSAERTIFLAQLVDGQLYDLIKDYKVFPTSNEYKRKDQTDLPKGSEEVFFDEMLSGKFTHLLVNKSLIFEDPSIIRSILDAPLEIEIKNLLLNRVSDEEILKIADEFYLKKLGSVRIDLAIKNTSDEKVISLFKDVGTFYSILKFLPKDRRHSILEKMDADKILSFLPDLSALTDFIELLPEIKRPQIIEKFGIEHLITDNLDYYFPKIFPHLSLTQKEKLISQLSTENISRIFHSFEILYSFIDQIPVSVIDELFEKLGEEKLFELSPSTVGINLLLPYLSDTLLSKILDRTYELVESDAIDDRIEMLPYLEQRHADRTNQKPNTQEIIKQFTNYLNFILENLRSATKDKVHTFFAANSQNNLTQLQQTINELDKTDNLSTAIKLITSLFDKSDSGVSSLFSRLAFADGGSLYFPQKGVLALSSEELKQFESHPLKPIKPEILDEKDFKKILDTKETLQDTLEKLNALVTITPEAHKSPLI
jgi:hypothetical protein